MKKSMMVSAALLVVGLAYAGMPALDVSPTGELKSAMAARDRIRELRKSAVVQPDERITVTFAPGDYDVRETLDLGKDDGFVTYRAAKKGTVRFSGAARLVAESFRPADAAEAKRFPSGSRDRIRVADVSAALPGEVCRWGDESRVPPGPWLYVDGEIRPIARWPNENPRGGWTNFTQVVDRGLAEPDSPDPARRVKHAGSFVFNAPCVANWDFAEGVWLYGYWTHDWFEQILKAKAWTATPTNHVMELAGVHPYGIAGQHTWGAANRRFFALNVPAELDAPGEWWLDRAAKRLYVMPTDGWPTADIRLAVLARPFVKAKDVKAVRFENIAFEYAHETAFSVSVKDCEDVVFDGCDFRNLGGGGIVVEGGRRCQVLRGDIRNLGATAVRIAGGDRKTLTRGDHVVADCTISNFARFWRTYNPGVGMDGVGQTVRNCVISDAPHNAILYSGNDHLIADNEICRVVQETSDSGAIYAGRDPTSLGNVIRGNYIHDLGKDPQFLASKWGGFIHGVYLDDCDWGESIVSNVFARCGGCAIFLCGGNLHETWGNVVVDCANGTGVDSRGRTWQSFSPMFRKPAKYDSWWHESFAKRGFDWRNPPWSTRYPRVAEVLAGEPDLPKVCPITNNCFVACGKNHHFDKETPAITNVLPICGNRYYRDVDAALAAGDPWLAACVRRTLKDKADACRPAPAERPGIEDEKSAAEARAGVAISERLAHRASTAGVRMSSTGDYRLPEKAYVVADTPGYNSWPMIQAMGTKLVCSYSRDNARPKDGHSIDPGSRDSYMRVSFDGGRTWSSEATVSADPKVGEVNEGIGLDSTGAALLWVRCWGKDRRHELYRTADGVTLEKIASLTPDPFPMQVMDPVAVGGLGLVSPWFAGSYRKGGMNSWGLLVSADGGHTWTQRVVEDGLSVKEWVTEPSLADLGNGRLLIIGRCEQNLGNQFQVTSTDGGNTWKKARTNIGDVQESTPSLVYDRATGLLANYYYHRGARQLKRRVVAADFIFDHPDAWPEPEVLDTGFEQRPFDAGNVKVARFGDEDCCAWYSGTSSNATVVVTIVSRP